MGSQIEKIKNIEKNNHIIIDDLSLCNEIVLENCSEFRVIDNEIKEENNGLIIAKVKSLKDNKIYIMKRIEKTT